MPPKKVQTSNEVCNDATVPQSNIAAARPKFSLLNRPIAKFDSKPMDKFLVENKKVESSALGIKVQRLDVAVAASINNEKRRLFTSGILPLDLQLAVRNRAGEVVQVGDAPGLHVLYSKTSQGKSVTLMTKVGQLVKNGLSGLLILTEQDSEEDLAYLLQMCEIDATKLVVSTDTDMESVLTTVEKAIGNYKGAKKKAAFDFIVVDSLDALFNKAESDKGTAKDDMALAARRLSRFFRINHGHMCRQGVRFYNISQYRSSMDAGTEWSIENYAGGNALKHYAKSILYVKRTSDSKSRNGGARFKISTKEEGAGVNKRGFIISTKLMKSKISGAIEGSTAYYDFFYMKGIDKLGSMFEAAINAGVIEKVNTVTYRMNGKEYRGMDAAENAFRLDVDTQIWVEQELIEKMRFHHIDFDKMADEELVDDEAIPVAEDGD